MSISTVLETLQTYRAAKNPVNCDIPQNFHGISTLGERLEGFKVSRFHPINPRMEPFGARLVRATVCLPLLGD